MAQAAAQCANTHDEKNPTFAKYIWYGLDEHASRTASPITLERYRDFAAYLTRHLGEIRINDVTTAQIQVAIHRLGDCGGIVTEAYPKGRPLAAKTVRHIGSMLYTSLSEADRLGILKIPHPMANKRVKLPKLPKRKPTVVEKAKLKAPLDRARTTRLYPSIVLASATGCRRGELLALQWPRLERQHRRTRRLQEFGADEGGPAREIDQIGRVPPFRGAALSAPGSRGAPRATGR